MYCFYFQGYPFECFGEKVESSFARVTTCSFNAQKPAIPDCAGSVKSDIDLDDKHQETEEVHFLDNKEHSKSAFLVTSCPLQSQLVDDHTKLDVLKYEVSQQYFLRNLYWKNIYSWHYFFYFFLNYYSFCFCLNFYHVCCSTVL